MREVEGPAALVDAMSLADHEDVLLRFVDWLVRARPVLAAAVLVFGALWAFGFMAAGPALAGFVLICAVALIMVARGVATREASAPMMPLAGASDGALVEAVLSGLPDAVVALDRAGAGAAARRADIARPAQPRSIGRDPSCRRECRGRARRVHCPHAG